MQKQAPARLDAAQKASDITAHTETNIEPKKLRLPKRFRDVTSERLGMTYGIVGATAAKKGLTDT